jgi:hypothetical protein
LSKFDSEATRLAIGVWTAVVDSIEEWAQLNGLASNLVPVSRMRSAPNPSSKQNPTKPDPCSRSSVALLSARLALMSGDAVAAQRDLARVTHKSRADLAPLRVAVESAVYAKISFSQRFFQHGI